MLNYLLESHNNLIIELCESEILEEGARMAWGRRGKKIVRKFRCSSGKRKGRLVSKLSQCSAPIDIKKRMNLKKTKMKMGTRIAKKAKRTKKFNPVSKRIRGMNKKR